MVSLTKWLLFAALAIASLHTSFGIKIDVGNSFFNEVQRSKRATQKATFSKGGEDYCNCECAAGCTPECPVCPKPCATCGGGGYEPPEPPPEPKTTEPTTTTEPPTTTTPEPKTTEPTTTTEPPTTATTRAKNNRTNHNNRTTNNNNTRTNNNNRTTNNNNSNRTPDRTRNI